MSILHRTVSVDGFRVFYREAGQPGAPAVLLLHGFPTSSHMFRQLIPRLAGRYHIVAPDLPGFGFSEAPPRDQFAYTFDHLAQVIDRFSEIVGLHQYAVYVFDYGAPIGFRLALAHPERITAIVTQNGNAYEDGLSEAWNPIQAYWRNPSTENRAALRNFLTVDLTRFQYVHGVSDPDLVAPEAYTLDQHLLDRPGNDEIQLDLFADYRRNLELYPRFQEYLRTYRPPTLAVWGEHDPFFVPAGAEAFRRDVPEAEVHLLPTGHFALETHADEITTLIQSFLGRVLPATSSNGHTHVPDTISRFYQALRANDVEAWLETFAPDAESQDPVGTPPIQGHQALRQFFTDLLANFARFDGLAEEECFPAGNAVAVRWTGRGLSRDGQPVVFTGIDVFELNVAGRIQSLRAYFDLSSLARQLQTQPSPVE
jgi:pimeloyl-ACP methyl ester carboxylesterase/ketosteroid isomerase-like protein